MAISRNSQGWDNPRTKKKKCKRISFSCAIAVWHFVRLLIVLFARLALEKFEELMNHCAGLWLVSLRIMADDEFP